MSTESGIEGCNYFQNLPDEILILIFTKVMCVDEEVDTLKDIMSLGRCSAVCKRFNSLVFQIPTLSIAHPSIMVLYKCCSKILELFKHIRYLHVVYESDTEGIMDEHDLTHIPHIFSKAIYDPHTNNYRLAVLTSASIDQYSTQQVISPTNSTIYTATESESSIIGATQNYAAYLFRLHHELFSSIREHKFLQRVVVTDLLERESFTLVEEQLANLRNAGSSLAQVQGCCKTGFYDIFSVPYSEDVNTVFENVSFCLFDKWESSSRPNNVIPLLEGRGVALQGALEMMLDPRLEEYTFCDYETLPKTLSLHKWR